MRRRKLGVKTEAISQPVTSDFDGLREALFDELNLLRAGKISNSRARITSQLSKRIIEAATLDLFHRSLLGDGTAKDLKRLMSSNVQ